MSIVAGIGSEGNLEDRVLATVAQSGIVIFPFRSKVFFRRPVNLGLFRRFFLIGVPGLTALLPVRFGLSEGSTRRCVISFRCPAGLRTRALLSLEVVGLISLW